MKAEKEISKLISKYFEGTISIEELQILFDYLNREEDNSELEKYSRNVWNSEENLFEANSEKSWSKIKDKMIEDKVKRLSYQNKMLKVYSIIGYAASFVIIVLMWALMKHKYTVKQDSLAGNAFIEYFVPYGSKSTVILPDSTKILLNSGSRLKYKYEFNKQNRMVYLDGEAFFEVKHSDKYPFIVKTNMLNIKVYGTSFNVKSFSEEKNIETTLLSGSVLIEKVDQKGKVVQNIRIKPKEIICYSKVEDKFILRTSESHIDDRIAKSESAVTEIKPIVTSATTIDKNVEEKTSWINNRITFRGDSINTLISKLERWYNVEITIKNKHLYESTFTGTFDNETIEQALNALKLITPFSYKIEKNKIIIY